MGKDINSVSGTAIPPTTTTEELIVQYLDGELLRKELETVLFDRLAQSDEARSLLREYLVVRGAIRQSASDERFQLSSDLDGRTRRRIEQMFERIAVEGFDVVFPASGIERAQRFLPDRARVATNPFARRTERMSKHPRLLRSSLALLVLLFAIGTTWYLTQGAREYTPMQIAESTPASTVLTPGAALAPQSSVVLPSMASVKAPIARAHEERNVVFKQKSEPMMAANDVSHSSVVKQLPAPAVQPTQDVMISDRFGREIEAAKHEVVISSRDRL